MTSVTKTFSDSSALTHAKPFLDSWSCSLLSQQSLACRMSWQIRHYGPAPASLHCGAGSSTPQRGGEECSLLFLRFPRHTPFATNRRGQGCWFHWDKDSHTLSLPAAQVQCLPATVAPTTATDIPQHSGYCRGLCRHRQKNTFLLVRSRPWPLSCGYLITPEPQSS